MNSKIVKFRSSMNSKIVNFSLRLVFAGVFGRSFYQRALAAVLGLDSDLVVARARTTFSSLSSSLELMVLVLSYIPLGLRATVVIIIVIYKGTVAQLAS